MKKMPKSKVTAGLQTLLEKRALSPDTRRDMVLQFVRKEHCGRTDLARFRAQHFGGNPDVDPELDVSVEEMVDDLMRLHYSDANRDRSLQAVKELTQEQTHHEGGDSGNKSSQEEEEEEEEEGKDPEFEPKQSEADRLRAVSTTSSTTTSNSTMCVPTSLLLGLVEKIDALHEKIESQSRLIQDVESRLNQEIQAKDRKILELVEEFSLNCACKVSSANVAQNTTVTHFQPSDNAKQSETSKSESSSSNTYAQAAKKSQERLKIDQRPVQTKPSTDHKDNKKESTARGKGQESGRNNNENDLASNSAKQPGSAVSKSSRFIHPTCKDSSYCSLLSSSDLQDEHQVKKAVFFIGHLRADAADGSLEDYVAERSEDVGVPVTVFNSKLFRKPDTNWCSGRITVNQDVAAVVGDRTFWPRTVYVRPWKFADDGERSSSPAGGQ